MKNARTIRITTIADYHKFRSLPKPEHPLISVINFEDIKIPPQTEPVSLVTDLYLIALKRTVNSKMRYGQQIYDFDAGVTIFLAPGQVFTVEAEDEVQHSGWLLLIHPDYLLNTLLTKEIHKYKFFYYSVNEALHLSDKEEELFAGILQSISEEYCSKIDTYSQTVIVARLLLLLTYSERFYNRQFIIRKASNHKILTQFEELLAAYFSKGNLSKDGLPTVAHFADQLHISSSYLSALLKMLTGQSPQQHIHDKLIETAKKKLSSTDLSVSEIAYALGFEHSQSFSRLFKNKVNLSPIAYRQSFN